MRTSASCRRAETAIHARHVRAGYHPGARPRGFTLLELTVVLSLVSLLTALIGPRLWGWVASARDRAEIDRVSSALQSLPSATFFAGRARQIATATDLGVTLPEGWYLETPTPLFYASNGMASGGRIALKDRGETRAEWQVEATTGEAILLEDTP